MEIQITPELLNRLKEKAEKATQDEWPYDASYLMDDSDGAYVFRVLNIDDVNYIAEINPQVILALLEHIWQLQTDQYEANCDASWEATMRIRAQRELDWACTKLDHVCDSFPSCSDCPLKSCGTEDPDFRKMASDAIDEEDEDMEAEVEAMNR